MSLRLGTGLGVGPRNDASVTPTVAPVNVAAPEVTGVGYVGQVLSCSRGTWDGMPGAFAYQWQRGGVDLPGEVGATYVVALADEGVPVRCGVVASNRIGTSVVAYSEPVEQWLPTDFAGLVRWYDPADASAVSVVLGRIAAIAPRFGTGALTQVSAGNQPLYSAFNGLGAIGCDSFGRSLNWGGMALTQDGPLSIMLGLAPPFTYANPRSGRVELRGSGQRFAFMARQDNRELVGSLSASVNPATSPPLVDAQEGVSSLTIVKTAGANYAAATAYHNSIEPSSVGPAAMTVGVLHSGNINAIGTTGNRGICTYLDIALCDAAMDAATVAKWQGYLAWRYRDTSNLTDDHPYKAQPPAVSVVAAPSAVSAVATSPGTILVAWTDETAEDARFQVLRRIAGETAWADLGLTSVGATEYEDAGLSPGVTYEYRIRARDEASGEVSLWAVREAAGGTLVYDIADGSHWTVHQFSADGGLTAPADIMGNLLLMGGGGGGGYAPGSGGGGGGAGRRIRQDGKTLLAGTYALTIGAGGLGAPSGGIATAGDATTFIGGTESIAAEGGGRGSNSGPLAATVGASAGGVGSVAAAGEFTAGDQSDGGQRGEGTNDGNRGAGGGGGAGEDGKASVMEGVGGDGGDGVSDWGVYRGGGGGGAVRFGVAPGGGAGGLGGGGKGQAGGGIDGGTAGAPNTGGGGGGGTSSGFSAGRPGGTGVGIFRINRNVSAVAQAS